MEELKDQNSNTLSGSESTLPEDSLTKGSLKVSPPQNLPLVIKDLSDLKAVIAGSTPPPTETPEDNTATEAVSEESSAPIIKKSFLADSKTDSTNQDVATKSAVTLESPAKDIGGAVEKMASNVTAVPESEEKKPAEEMASKTEIKNQAESLKITSTSDNSESGAENIPETKSVVSEPILKIEPELTKESDSLIKPDSETNSPEKKETYSAKTPPGFSFLGKEKPADLDLDHLPIINAPKASNGKSEPAEGRRMKGLVLFLIFLVFFLLVVAVLWYYNSSVTSWLGQKSDPSSPSEPFKPVPATSPTNTPSSKNDTLPVPGEVDPASSGLEPEVVLEFPGQFQLNLAQNKETFNFREGDNLPLKIKELGNAFAFDYPVQVALFWEKKEMTLDQFKKALGIVIPANMDASGQKKFAFLLAKEEGVVKSVLVLETATSPESNKVALLDWEATMVGDLNGLKLGELTEDPANAQDFRFRDSVSLPNSRYINLSQSKKITLEYTILADKILISTSETVMVKIFELK